MAEPIETCESKHRLGTSEPFKGLREITEIGTSVTSAAKISKTHEGLGHVKRYKKHKTHEF